MNVAIGCDEAAYDLKEALKSYLADLGHEVTDYGTFDAAPVLYPDIAFEVATAVVSGRHERGILVCGTGIGMAISANKVPGIRAAQAHDTYSAQRARMSNDAQIVTMGSRVIGPELAKAIAKDFLDSDFQGGRSQPKVDRILAFEKRLAAPSPGQA